MYVVQGMKIFHNFALFSELLIWDSKQQNLNTFSLKGGLKKTKAPDPVCRSQDPSQNSMLLLGSGVFLVGWSSAPLPSKLNQGRPLGGIFFHLVE